MTHSVVDAAWQERHLSGSTLWDAWPFPAMFLVTMLAIYSLRWDKQER